VKQTILIGFLVILVSFVFAGIVSTFSSDPRSQESTFALLCNRANSSTQAQWDKIYKDEIQGLPLSGTGKITNVSRDDSGYFAWIDLGKRFSGNDLRIDHLPENIALSLSPNQTIEFTGTVNYFSQSCIVGVDYKNLNTR